jgi:malate synthase
MTARTPVHRLQVATELHQFIEEQVLPGTGVASAFWAGFDAIVADLAPKNIALLAERDRLQRPSWTPGTRPTPARSRPCGKYAQVPGEDRLPGARAAKVKATTFNVDAELATQAGPQLVVPIPMPATR